MAITLRNTKGLPLTHIELDGNFTDLDTRLSTLESASDSDNQTLTLAGDTLSISGGNSVDLSKYTDSTFSGDFDDLTDNPFTRNIVGSPTPSVELSFTGSVFDFGDGKTIDMQNSSILFTSSTITGFVLPAASPADTNAIDITKQTHFLTHGHTYTLADGITVGQELTFWINTAGAGITTVNVANAKYFQNNIFVVTNYNWEFQNDGAKWSCIWDGSHWILDRI
jgi:hypothetical protein